MLSARHHDAYIKPKHHRHLLNPADQAAVTAGSVDVFGGMEKVHDETMVSAGSAMSDLSAMENETDDFGRKLIQHQREIQQSSGGRENPRAFRKARPRPRIAERLEREEQEKMQLAEREEHQRAASGSSIDSEPPINVPREWGRKARRQGDWMRKIREPSIASKSEEEGEVKQDADQIYPRRTSHAFSGDENPLQDWDAADYPLQAIENTPPSMRRRAPLPTPSSMHHMNTTIKSVDTSEDGDFNAASLLASTPATRLPRKIDELTQREIANIERRGLTTRALDHIDELSPNATRRTSRNSLREQALADGMERSPTSPTARPISAPTGMVTSPSKIPRRPGSALGNNKENLPFTEANSSYKSTRTTGLSDRTAHAVNANAISQHASSRPAHKRNDSMGLLRRLARVSSMSPSPARKEHVSPGKKADVESRPSSAEEAGASKPVARKVDFEKESTAVTGQPAATNEPEVSSAKPDQGSRAASDGANAQDGEHIQDLETARIIKSDRNPFDTKPTARKSALDDLVYQARHGDNTQQYGENTMASLEDIAHPNFEQTDPTITFDYDTLQREQQAAEADELLTQVDKDQRQKDLALEAMEKHLNAAHTSIKDVNRGLRRVGNRIDSADDTKPAVIRTISDHTKTIVVQNAKGHVYCTCHSRNSGSAWWSLWTEFRSLFYTYGTEPSAASSWLTIRPTWLGLAVLLCLSWYLSETTLCSYFCNPRFASWVDDYPDPNAPQYPFVIPTLVLQPTRWLWQPVCNALAWAFGVCFHAMFGDSSSSARPPRITGVRRAGVRKAARKVAAATGGQWAATATTVARRAAQSVVDVVDEAGSMWGDEPVV